MPVCTGRRALAQGRDETLEGEVIAGEILSYDNRSR